MVAPETTDGEDAEDYGRLQVSLRVQGDELDPVQVTEWLGVPASFAARKGEIVNRKGRTTVQRSGIWLLKGEDQTGWELDRSINLLLNRLPTDVGVWKTLGDRYALDVFCGLFMRNDNQADQLRPETVARLGRLGIGIGLDVYAP